MSSQPAPAQRLLGMLGGYRVVQALYAAAELGLADHLATGAKTAEALALEIGTHQRSLHRLLRALAGIGLLEEKDGGNFALTDVGELLRSDVPGSLRPAVLFYGGRRHWT